MSDFLGLDISGAGMSVQRQRLRVIAENLANQQTTGPDGPYQRKRVVIEAAPVDSFAKAFDGALAERSDSDGATSVRVAAVRPDGAQPVRVYDPHHPHADRDGYVELPNISVFREMAEMMEASRAYEANLAASKSTQDMLHSALDLLRR
ncbi:MAG TPA: flagellar basal body rod protein FlgC [Candidatus Sumerlaeota bacterium]|nr:flagellar basal body rod protein FlgC [Candidatus Sumerlaeota bacterium]HPK01384.1 flagellar basal body rod protein FlgC [Candidatus Sumerlaeota bacterium]